MDDVVALLRLDPKWEPALVKLRALKESHGAYAAAAAADYARVYAGCRGAMIVDVVGSRQRKYETRVKKMVADWKSANEDHTIARLSERRLEAAQFGISEAEVETIATVAQHFRDFSLSEGITDPADEDRLCRVWADRVESVDHAPSLDPVVGSVRGIGMALWSYMRMRSGANAIKIDVRVKRALRELGFPVPDDDHAALMIAKAAAQEVDLPLLVLDQLLWAMGNFDSAKAVTTDWPA